MSYIGVNFSTRNAQASGEATAIARSHTPLGNDLLSVHHIEWNLNASFQQANGESLSFPLQEQEDAHTERFLWVTFSSSGEPHKSFRYCQPTSPTAISALANLN